MFRLFVMSTWVLVRLMTPVTAKTIVSPGAATATCCRNDPGPSLEVLVTVSVAASVFGERQSAATAIPRQIRLLTPPKPAGGPAAILEPAQALFMAPVAHDKSRAKASSW